MNDMAANLIELAQQDRCITALWLYGSRALGNEHAESDYDLAVLFADWCANALERRLRPEELALEWQQQCGLPDDKLSIVDIGSCSIPLAWSVLTQGKLLVDKQPDKRMKAEARIYSMWEIDYVHDQKLA